MDAVASSFWLHTRQGDSSSFSCSQVVWVVDDVHDARESETVVV